MDSLLLDINLQYLTEFVWQILDINVLNMFFDVRHQVHHG